MFLGTLSASLLGHMLSGKGIYGAGKEWLELVIDLKDLQSKNIFNSTPSFNFEIQKYYHNELRFNVG